MFTFFQAIVNSSALGEVRAKTDKSYYVPGELVTGSISLDARLPLSASGIDLTLTGYEKTEWHDRSSRTEVVRPAYTDGNGHHHPAQTRQIPQLTRKRAKKVFFSQHQRIYQIAGGLMAPGQYTFPFQYQLADGLPGSFYERTPLTSVQPGTEMLDHDGVSADAWYDSDDEYSGRRSRGPHDYERSAVLGAIVYKLKVTLDLNGAFLPDLWTKVMLVLHPKLAVQLQPAMQELTQQVVVCCCINKGNCSVCARFDKLAYVAGETADVRADIKNESTSQLTTRVVLRRYLTLSANNGKRQLSEDIVQQSYEVVQPQTNSLDRKMPLQLAGDKVKPTTNGSLVHCNYEYLVECGVSMGSDIRLKMPVTIYAPQPPPPSVMSPMSPASPMGVAAVMPASPSQPMAMQSSPMMAPPQQQPYGSQPMQQPMQQPYGGQPMQQPYGGQPMQQPYAGQPMMGQQQPYGSQPMPQQAYGGQPMPMQQQPYGSQPMQPMQTYQ